MGVFDNLLVWQNYIHYLLLAIGVYFWHEIPINGTVEQFFMTNHILGFVVLVLYWAVGLFVIDTIVHAIFYVLPEPYRWRD